MAGAKSPVQVSSDLLRAPTPQPWNGIKPKVKAEEGKSDSIKSEKSEKNERSEVKSHQSAKNEVNNSKKEQSDPQLFLDLPSKTEEALQTFTPIEECTFANRNLGNSGQDELMACDCKPIVDPRDGSNHACGEDSDCINRLTSIECVNDMCNCGDGCQNQRFQARQYAHVDIIMTEKKGYGMRASSDIPANTFIYEYIGEVIDEGKFRKRMKQYEEQKIKHFYFMMLQKGEFIDATRKGCLARFCNHSCRPNSFVDKWVVGQKLRMGIFSKRNILKGEEITFDYNVDRYGSQAQPCYCGESNCIGYLGGKTQTEAASKLPQLLIDALGLDYQDESQWITTTAKKKRPKKKLAPEDLEEEYDACLPTKPIDAGSVSKVMTSLLQSREEWLIKKLISRIHMTDDDKVQLQVMRMHGYQIFSALLRDWNKVEVIPVMILEILTRWPKMTKNKISSSKIEATVMELQSEANVSSKVQELAKSLIQEWSQLQMAYRIPRRERPIQNVSGSPADNKSEPLEREGSIDNQNASKTPKKNGDEVAARRERDAERRKKKKERKKLQQSPNGPKPKLPAGWDFAYSPEGKIYYFNRDKNITMWDKPKFESPDPKETEAAVLNQELQIKAEQKAMLEKIIEQAQEQQRLLAKQQTELEEKKARKESKMHHHSSNHKSSPDKKKRNLERTLTNAFAGFVPNMVAKVGRGLDRDEHKKCSKDIVHILVSKETRDGHVVKDPTTVSEDKKKKVYAFVKQYMEKFMAKREIRQATKRPNDEASVSPAKKIKGE